jgi:predicted Rossmann fold nucleotide-binding protein DprA/Smf involved in DNA uptake
MPKRDSDLFARLRRAGIRKQVATALSELSEDAGKKAVRAGHSAAAELRALADEIEKRLPGTPTHDQPTPAAPTRRRATTPRRAAAARTRKPAAVASPAPRGQNKAKILAALKDAPRTASEISKETGIASGTVSSTLTKMAKAGEVTKATRGYALPK